MEELMELIIEYFNQKNKAISIQELKKVLNIKGEDKTNIFNEALNQLVEDGKLFFDGKTYKLFTNDLGYAYGEIDINRIGNGIIHTPYGIIFIDNKNLNGALNGDKVIISNITASVRKSNFEGEVFKILKRKSGKVIFRVKGDGLNASLIPYNENENINILLNKNEMKSLKNGDYISVIVSTEKIDDKFLAEINKVLGNADTKNIDVKILFEEYDIPVNFSKDALNEAKMMPDKVFEYELENRVDLRDKEILTIDCDNTKDRDDAIYIEKLDNGNYKLFVNISDVSHYVKRGTKLFEEALIRCNSHYVNNTCNPMFPTELSNGICSLNADVDRLTKTVEMEIAPDGKVVNYNIYKSVINSKKAMKYSKVNKVLNGEYIEEYDRFKPQLLLMQELNNILEKARYNRNYIDFNIRDVEQIENEFGDIVDFKQAETGCAQQMIENFMVIANETVAKHFYWIPFIFRIHEEPDEKSVKEVLELLRISGYNIPQYKNVNENVLKGILIKLNEIDNLDIAKSKILRRMKKARYCVDNLGHYALQLNHYCHFTSPIRRIADFIIHTLIDEVESLDFNIDNIKKQEKELYSICENASRLERISKQIEEDGMYLEMAKYMEKYIGKEFEAYISEIYQHGMLVKTNNMIVGKINFPDMKDDNYYFDHEKQAIIGKNSKNKFTIGQKVYVIVKEASKTNRIINFELPKQKIKKI